MKVLAETASNHMGDIDYLLELTIKAYNNGADFVTFQMFSLEDFITASYSNYNFFKGLEISLENWKSFIRKAINRKIDLIPCVLDRKSMQVCKELEIEKIKIHSTDILNTSFLNQCGNNFQEIFLEVGGATIEDICIACKCLSDTNLTLIYGFNGQPTKIGDQNLNFVRTLKDLFKTKIGFADHTTETDFIPLLAMAMGADVLEKHVTLESGNKDRLDWQVSVEPEGIRRIKKLLEKYSSSFGEEVRVVKDAERKFRDQIYKRMVAADNLSPGDIITDGNIKFKRSKEGLTGEWYANIIDKTIVRNIKRNEPIFREDVE